MKKILTLALTVVVASVVNAASFSWKTSTTGKVQIPGGGEALTTGSYTAYIFDSALYSQSDMVKAYAEGKLDLAGSTISSTTGKIGTNGAVSSTDLEYGKVGLSYDFYFAAIIEYDGKEYLFISNTGTGAGVEGKTTTINLNGKSSLVADASAGFSGAGYYSAVPEPTSAMLLVLGVAALALRRKRD